MCVTQSNVSKSRSATTLKKSYKNCKKTYSSEVCCAVNQVFSDNKFEALPDFVTHHLDKQFSFANNYAEDINASTPNNYDNFQKTIKFKNNKYHVDVPFEQEILDKVSSSFSVCKVLAKKVHNDLKKRNLQNDYF